MLQPLNQHRDSPALGVKMTLRMTHFNGLASMEEILAHAVTHEFIAHPNSTGSTLIEDPLKLVKVIGKIGMIHL